MRKLLYLLFIFSIFAHAQNKPFVGEYKYCYDDNNQSIQAYLNLVDFQNAGLGIQIYTNGFPISIILKLNGQSYITTERISGYEFEYRAFYKNNLLKIVFTDERDAQVLGLNQTHVIKFQGALVSFVFDQIKIHCRQNI